MRRTMQYRREYLVASQATVNGSSCMVGLMDGLTQRELWTEGDLGRTSQRLKWGEGNTAVG